MNHIGYFEIQSSNPQRDILFYQTLFGWKFEQVKNAPVEYYRITTENLEGGLLKRPLPVPPNNFGTNAFACSIIVSNFNKTSDKIIQLGGQIAIEKFAIPQRCWQGYFRDLDQNFFGICEIDENANV